MRIQKTKLQLLKKWNNLKNRLVQLKNSKMSFRPYEQTWKMREKNAMDWPFK